MVKKILIALGISTALLLAANGVVAVSPFAREAVKGLPLQKQIFFLANEIDAVKAEQACMKANDLKLAAMGSAGIINKYSLAGDIEAFKEILEKDFPDRLSSFLPKYGLYLEALKECER